MIRYSISLRPEYFNMLIYGNSFSDLGSGGLKKKEKSSENDPLTSHFPSIFSSSELF